MPRAEGRMPEHPALLTAGGAAVLASSVRIVILGIDTRERSTHTRQSRLLWLFLSRSNLFDTHRTHSYITTP